MRKSIITYIQENNIRLLGLSGSPHTKGMGKVYSKVTGLTTMRQLVEDYKKLVPLRVFVCQEIDMQGSKKVANEWSDKEVTERGIKITGDVVHEWHKKTLEVYGEIRKTIVFCAGTAHGINLEQNYKAAGFNFVAISYKNTEEFKAEVLAEFAKPDSNITGVISCEILVKGFDVPDVHIIVDARPLSKSFSSHVQKLGRGMRGYPGKEYCTLIDHSGNYLRFKDQWDELYNDGVMELDDGAEKTKAEPTKDQKDAAKCPVCGALWDHPGDVCSHCGHTRIRRNEVKTVPGEMVEIEGEVTKKEKYTSEFKESFYRQLLGYCRRHGKADGYAWHLYKEKFMDNALFVKVAVEPGPEVLNFIRSRNIARAKGMSR
jgi:superfamily II DNA or RNA helicase